HTVASGECAECAKHKTGIQRKLAIGASSDPLEREADRVADQVLATPAHSVVSGAPLYIQRFAGQPTGQMDTAPASVDQTLASPGRPLEPVLRQDMEQRFGHDFSRVRVHSGAAAEQSARDVNAHAYAVGHNIVFGAGLFAPGTHEGRRLIAHELTHVVQQTGSNGIRLGQCNDKRGLSPISHREAHGRNLLRRSPRRPDSRSPLPHREAMEATERALYEAYVRDCSGVRVLSRLEKEPPISRFERARRLEDRLKYIRLYFHQERSRFRHQPTANDIVNMFVLRCVKECVFGKEYAPLSEEGELAITQCALSETRWQSVALAHRGHIPGSERSLDSSKAPWIPDPRVCFSRERMDKLRELFDSGRGCEGEVRTEGGPVF
ncbi:DUF4157 domain-containing protein, partial [Devosia sp.]|uniref:eCIS core domain-containing protein n=1 Tax=Devosia sp. TaxID=1871048 RepID=UPI002736F2E5